MYSADQLISDQTRMLAEGLLLQACGRLYRLLDRVDTTEAISAAAAADRSREPLGTSVGAGWEL